MALSPAYADLATKISTDLTQGVASRGTLGENGVAFSWTQNMPTTMANFCAVAQAAGQSVPVTRVAPSGTPAAIVAEGGTKPSALTISTTAADLSKHAGQANFNLERRVAAPNVVPEVLRSLSASLLLSFETEAIATVTADAGGTPVTGGGAWLTNIVSAQGQIIGAGGRPGLLVMAPADWATLVNELSVAAGLCINPTDGSAVGELLGSLIHVSPGAVAGTAHVLDADAVVCFESEDGVLFISDPYSAASTNSIIVTADLFASAFVSSPGLVVPVTVA